MTRLCPLGHSTRSTCTDTGNADRFTQQHGDKLRYVPGWGWIIYTGKRWEIDEHNQVIKLAKATARSIYAAAAEAQSDDVADKLAKWAKASLARPRLESMVFLARPELPASADQFDLDPFLLNCCNGIMALRTGDLFPHDPAAMCSRITGVNFNENARASRWHDFLPEIFDNDADLLTFTRRWMGYSLTGLTHEQRYIIAWVTRYGKSTLFDILRYIMGDYAVSITRHHWLRTATPATQTASLPKYQVRGSRYAQSGIRICTPMNPC